MSDKSLIEWTDATVNPILARRSDGKLGFHCEKVSPGCAHCYAEVFNRRELPARGTGQPYTKAGGASVEIVVHRPALEQMLRWRKPRKIFVCSMTDLFGSFVRGSQQQEVIDSCVDAAKSGHTIQLLTKHPQTMLRAVNRWRVRHNGRRLPERVWLGFSAEDQERFEARWGPMRALTSIHDGPIWCSWGPALAPLDITRARDRLSWLVVDGESGPKARPCDLFSVRCVREQCKHTSTRLFVKQLGSSTWVLKSAQLPSARVVEESPCGVFVRVKWRDPKGGDWDEWPGDLRVREWPR